MIRLMYVGVLDQLFAKQNKPAQVIIIPIYAKKKVSASWICNELKARPETRAVYLIN